MRRHVTKIQTTRQTSQIPKNTNQSKMENIDIELLFQERFDSEQKLVVDLTSEDSNDSGFHVACYQSLYLDYEYLDWKIQRQAAILKQQEEVTIFTEQEVNGESTFTFEQNDFIMDEAEVGVVITTQKEEEVEEPLVTEQELLEYAKKQRKLKRDEKKLKRLLQDVRCVTGRIAQYHRSKNFCFMNVGDEGLMEVQAGELAKEEIDQRKRFKEIYSGEL